MATDNFVPKMILLVIFRLDYNNIEKDLWPLSVDKMFMVASKISSRLVKYELTRVTQLDWNK